MKYDLIVFGSGPAGYVAAIKAAQFGKKVLVIDKDPNGGTCNNWGCIPAKALLRSAALFDIFRKRGAEFGIHTGEIAFNWSDIIRRSRTVVEKGSAGVDYLFRKNHIDSIRGIARLDQAGEVTVAAADGSISVHQGERILIATGCVSRPLPNLPFDGAKIIGSKEALNLGSQPESIIILGAGAIGVEFAYFFNAFGTKVTLVEMLPRLLPVEDEDISKALGLAFAKQGIEVLTNTRVTAAAVAGDHVDVRIADADGERAMSAELLLVAIGIQPVLPDANLIIERDESGFLRVGESYETNVPGIFAAGDIIGPPWLAHVASFEAEEAVKGMFQDGYVPKKVSVFPGCTYCEPQVASVGLTERAAREQGLAVRIGKFPFSASGKARASGETEGFVKLIVGEKHGEILGAHIIGAEATEMIGELCLAIEAELTITEIEATIHAHPTFSEAVRDAAEVAAGHAIHI